jgi:hypothetical protein
MYAFDFVAGHFGAFAKWFGDGHPPAEISSWVSQIIVAVIALAAAAIAYRQVKAFGALELVKFMQQENVRTARWHVRTELAGKPLAEWTGDDKVKAATVCSSFDLMGFLLRKKLAPRKAYIKLYAATIQRTHNNLAEYLAHERSSSQNGPEFWNCFNWLNDEAKRIQPFKPD